MICINKIWMAFYVVCCVLNFPAEAMEKRDTKECCLLLKSKAFHIIYSYLPIRDQINVKQSNSLLNKIYRENHIIKNVNNHSHPPTKYFLTPYLKTVGPLENIQPINDGYLSSVKYIDVSLPVKVSLKPFNVFNQERTSLQLNHEGAMFLSLLPFDHLLYLDMSGNRIRRKGLDSLLQAQVLANLKTLNLAGNEFTDKDLACFYSEKCRVLNLDALNLSQNKISYKKVSSFANTPFSQLGELSLKSNKISYKHFSDIMSLTFPKLKSLDLSSNNIRIEEDQQALSQIKNYYLENLFIQENRIDLEDLKCLSLNLFIYLKNINLERNRINDRGIGIMDGLKLPSLLSLKLGYNYISSQGFSYLVRSVFPLLSVLDIQSNNIGDRISEHIHNLNYPSLKEFNISKNSLFMETEFLSSIDKFFPLLERFYLNENDIGDTGLYYLSRANLANLSGLELIQVGATDKGMKYLSLSSFYRLTHLSLQRNKIRDFGVRYLCQARFPLLREISLEENNIGGEIRQYFPLLNFPRLESVRWDTRPEMKNSKDRVLINVSSVSSKLFR